MEKLKPRAGIPPRTPFTMSLSARPVRRIFFTGITRSQSFAGVNTPQDKSFRNLKVFSTPTTQRKSTSRAGKMFTISHKSPPPKTPQPERLDEVYEALKKGLNAYLHVHQLELDSLTSQLKDMKRNSRLGFLYDLDKQIKSIERFIRRLEFHLSKIDELYEAYCIQRRLRDGANNMVRAYSVSLGSKEAKESLVEANKGYKEYTESMCTMENELENQLGEFHVKMKGLAGFARLCPGDQYEIFMKYGRQRWKLKGRIEANGRQVWDGEDMVFQPLITEFLSIKVTELKSLANHVIVGNVSCETKDLFAALPQSVAVDINDLGTIKLSLEVIWNPFDKDDQTSVASTVTKTSTVNKRFSTYNQSPPDTPSLREQAFYNMLRRQDELENGTAWSISSDSSDGSSSPQLSTSVRHSQKASVQPDTQAAASRITIALAQTEEPQAHQVTSRQQQQHQEEEEEVQKHAVLNGNVPISRTLSHISEVSVDAAMDFSEPDDSDKPEPEIVAITNLVEEPEPPEREPVTVEMINITVNAEAPLGNEETPEAILTPVVAMDIVDSVAPVELVISVTSTEEKAKPNDETAGPTEPAKVKPVDAGVDEALMTLNSTLEDYRGQFPELQKLEMEVKHLEEVLMHRQGVSRSRASSISLTVEHALESFDFLNTSDMEDSEYSEDEAEKNGRQNGSNRRLAAGPSEALTEDTGVGSGSEASPVPMTTGNEYLDQVLVMHLNTCSKLFLQLGIYGPLRCREIYALDKLLREAHVLETVSRLSAEKAGNISTIEEVTPLFKDTPTLSSFWKLCIDTPNVYSTSVERFLQKLNSSFGNRVKEKHSGIVDKVFVKLVERFLDRTLPKRARSGNVELLTIFQYLNHIEAENVSSLDSYILELAEEVLLVQTLQSSDKDVVLKTLKHLSATQLQGEGLKAVGLLLLEEHGKICSTATTVLKALTTENPKFREKALVYYLELLEDENVQLRRSGCTALGCLKAKESIDQLVYICQTDKEVRDVAKQALLSFGEEGKIACKQMEESLDNMQRLLGPVSMTSTAF
ncbi:rho family-interacting cell polarization regulator 1 isoform X1 [Callorhinchus milii]|uniref:rho family-interacting cell polarization regulator 1 isoform X1 n=2 Tax=Callorhinchus milii TaxID=7868 RepID=UPI001C3FF10A|nr:rho family-interacting cell polarization regulator 1 isoform X1 [Callorhinchus milii]